MQIHEITRRKVNEGILKGVANTVKGVAKAPLNTAEYFANKMLNAAGVPQDQQGTYSKYGHMAAGQRTGIASIEKQEQHIANELSKEWASTRTLNGARVDTLDPAAIEKAALAYNSGSDLKINAGNVANTVQTLAPQLVADKEEQQRANLAARARSQVEIKNLMAELEKEYNITIDPSIPDPTKQQAENNKKKIVADLKKFGYPVDEKYMANTTAAAQNAVVQTGGAQMMSTPAAPAPVAPTPAKPVSTASPAGYNYASVMKMPGMNQPVKKPAPAPAVAESLAWSKNFDPSMSLYDRMKRENK